MIYKHIFTMNEHSTNRNLSYFSILMALVILTLVSCSSGPTVFEETPLLNFHKKYEQTNKPELKDVDNSLNVFIDYSNGMYDPIQQMDDFYSFIFTIIQDDKADFYKVGEDSLLQIEKADVIENAMSPYYYKDIKNFDEKESRLRDAVQTIVKNNNQQSLFITDFEMYEGVRTLKPTNCGESIKTGINNTPWAKEEFSSWLNEGNIIDVYAHPFMKEDSARFMYFILFSPGEVAKSDDLSFIRNRMEKEGYHKTNDKMVEWFSFSKKDFGLQSPQKLEPIIALGTSNQFSKENIIYTWYDFNVLQHLKKTKPEPIIRGVKFEDFSAIYDDFDFKIKVFDVNQSFEAFKLNDEKARVLMQESPFTLVVEREGKDLYDLGIDIDPMNVKNANSVNLYQVEYWVKNAKKKLPEEHMKRILGWVDPRCLPVYSLENSLNEAASRLLFEEEYLFSIFFELHR